MMMDLIWGLVIGLLIGLIAVPFIFWVYLKIKMVFTRRKIKRMVAEGKFLKPTDKRDFDPEAWANEINLEEIAVDLQQMVPKIFNPEKNRIRSNEKGVNIQ